MAKRLVECGEHGARRPAFVCHHLNLVYPVGFNEPEVRDETDPDFDDELQAWCDACEKVRAAEGEWNDVSEAFADIKLICAQCFCQMKRLNQGRTE